MNGPDKYEMEQAEITAIYHENKGRYGYRRITIELDRRGIHLNHKTVRRLMKELGLVCRVRMKKYRSYKGETGKIAPNLLKRDFHAEKPNQKWVTDVTEFSLFGKKLYLSPILDLYSSDLVSYTISDRPVLNMVISMLDKAFETIPALISPLPLPLAVSGAARCSCVLAAPTQSLPALPPDRFSPMPQFVYHLSQIYGLFLCNLIFPAA